MPVPPPPPPPPPPSASGLRNVPPKTNERAKLLNEIHAGAKLRKVVTNDRSAPMVGVLQNSSTPRGPAMRGGSSGPQGLPLAPIGGAPIGGGGLFVNGLPRKPSDNKKAAASHNGTAPGALRPRLPSLPKPSSTPHMDNATSHNATPPLKSPLHSPRVETKTSSAPHLDSSESNSATTSVSRIAAGLDHFNQSSNSEAPSAPSSSSWLAARRELFDQTLRPPQAPPTPPSAKTKPSIPGVGPVKKFTPPATVNITRNTSISNRSQARRSGSFEDMPNGVPSNERSNPPPPPPPLNPPSSARITKPACPPPPPPPQPPRGGNRFGGVSRSGSTVTSGVTSSFPPPQSAQTQFNKTVMALSSQLANIPKIDDDNDSDSSAAPPPPPRGSSCSSDLMDRFKFIPIADLPPPCPFSGVKKVYG